MNPFFVKVASPRRGQGLVEFALVFPLILFLTMGMIEIARLLAIYSSLSNASREATRWGSVVGLVDSTSANSYAYLDCQGMKDAAVRGLLLWTEHTTTIQYDHGGGTPFATCSQYTTPTAGITNGDRIVVTVVGTYQPITPFVDTIITPQTLTFVSARSIFTGITIGTPSTGASTTCYALTVTANPSNSGTIGITQLGPTCSTNGQYADSVSLSASSTNYKFSNWTYQSSGALVDSTSPNPLTLSMDGTKSIYANFLKCESITLTTSPSNSGTTSYARTADCPNASSVHYTGQVEITAAASNGYKFTRWQTTTQTVSSSASYTVNVVTGTTYAYTAVFNPCYTVDLVQATGGTAAGSASDCGNGTYNSITLSATPSDGYQFQNWSGLTTTVTTNPLALTLDTNRTITPSFAQCATASAITSVTAGADSYAQLTYTRGTTSDQTLTNFTITFSDTGGSGGAPKLLKLYWGGTQIWSDSGGLSSPVTASTFSSTPTLSTTARILKMEFNNDNFTNLQTEATFKLNNNSCLVKKNS